MKNELFYNGWHINWDVERQQRSKWIPGFFLSLFVLFLLTLIAPRNGKPAHISSMAQGTLINQNPDEGWALFREKGDDMVLLETHDRTLEIGQTYKVIDHPVPVPKVGYMHTFYLKKVS